MKKQSVIIKKEWKHKRKVSFLTYQFSLEGQKYDMTATGMNFANFIISTIIALYVRLFNY